MKWEHIENILPLVDRALLHGPPGTGKTTAATKQGNKYYSVTLHADMSAQELIGHFIPTGGGNFTWHDGPAIRAWREGSVLIVNELDQASGSVMTELLSIMDDKSIAEKTLVSGETLKPHADFRVVGTMNGDPDTLPAPLLDRMDAVILVDMPSPEALKLLTTPLRKLVVNAYRTKTYKLSFRKALSVQRLMDKKVDVDQATEAIFPTDARAMADAISIGTRE